MLNGDPKDKIEEQKHIIQQPIKYFILARVFLRFSVLKAWDPLGGSQIFSNEIQSYKKMSVIELSWTAKKDTSKKLWT